METFEFMKKNKVADMLKQKGVIFPPPFITVMPQWFE